MPRLAPRTHSPALQTVLCVRRAIINYRKNGVATKRGKGNANREAPTALEANITTCPRARYCTTLSTGLLGACVIFGPRNLGQVLVYVTDEIAHPDPTPPEGVWVISSVSTFSASIQFPARWHETRRPEGHGLQVRWREKA